LLDAPVEEINKGLDAIGIDANVAEGLREATGMGPVLSIVLLGGLAAGTYYALHYSGLGDAIKNFRWGDHEYEPAKQGGGTIW
jgi:hypothetical protein